MLESYFCVTSQKSFNYRGRKRAITSSIPKTIPQSSSSTNALYHSPNLRSYRLDSSHCVDRPGFPEQRSKPNVVLMFQDYISWRYALTYYNVRRHLWTNSMFCVAARARLGPRGLGRDRQRVGRSPIGQPSRSRLRQQCSKGLKLLRYSG